jgi:hypothetical protein
MFRELAKNAKRINVTQLVLLVAKSNTGLIADNVREQLSQGKAGDNVVVGIYTSLPYAVKKAKISQAPFGTVDLKVSGDLYKNLKVDLTLKSVDVDSTVSYSKYQITRYGKRIYDNTPENSEKVRDKNSGDSVREYQKALGL